jgi:dipeptidyl aminopeptidase/acylaminoacyl peptidase
MKSQEEMEDLAAIGAIYPENYIGFVNDLTGYYRDPIPFDEVQCPTFILHGDKDKDVDLSNAE